MTGKTTGNTTDNTPQEPLKKAGTREERLKAALKANMGRRKAQARARKTVETPENKA